MDKKNRILWFLIFSIPIIIFSAFIVGLVNLYFEDILYIGDFPFPLTYLITALILGIFIPIVFYLLIPRKKRMRSDL